MWKYSYRSGRLAAAALAAAALTAPAACGELPGGLGAGLVVVTRRRRRDAPA